MKKILAGVALTAVTLMAAASDSGESHGISDSMQRFYYEQGYKKAKDLYEVKGYMKALRDFERLLAGQKDKWRAYEAGKYLIKEGKITYPQVYRVRQGDAYKVVIECSEVEGEFSERELFILPLLDKIRAESLEDDTDQSIPEVSGFVDDGFSVVEKDPSIVSKPYSVKNKISVDIPYKNEGLKSMLDSHNVEYAPNENGYRIFFTNERERDFFCLDATGNNLCEVK